MDERQDMMIYFGNDEVTTQYLSVFFPEIGNMTITFERRGHREGDVYAPVVSVDFAVENVDIIDARGNDRSIT